jgi:hypothetical protein
VLVDFAELVTPPVLVAAVAGALLGGRTARALAAGALAWVALVALMTQAGYAGNPRYNVVPAALACALAGAGIAAVARGGGRVLVAGALAVVLGGATLAFTGGDLADQVDEMGARADRREDLNALTAGSAVPCPPLRTNQPMKAMVAWRFDVAMEHLADPAGGPVTVLAAPPDYDGGPALPPTTGLRDVGRAGDWTLATSCPVR